MPTPRVPGLVFVSLVVAGALFAQGSPLFNIFKNRLQSLDS